MKRIDRNSIRTFLRPAATLAALNLFVGMMAAQVPVVGTIETQRSLTFQRDRMELILSNVSSVIEKQFFDPQLKGVKWEEAKAQARQSIQSSSSEMDMVLAIFRLVDTLGDSHTVFAPPAVAVAAGRHTPNLSLIVNQINRHPYEMEKSSLAIVQTVGGEDFFAPPRRSVTPQYGFEAKPFGERVTIYDVTQGESAAAAGLQVGDVVLSINGIPAEKTTFDLMMLYFRALNPVTQMQISYAHEDDPPRTAAVAANIHWNSYEQDLEKVENFYQFLREVKSKRGVSKSQTYEGGIGYLQLAEFMTDSRRIGDAVNDVEKSRAMIIDLRGSPGGTTDTLKSLAGLFLAKDAVIASLASKEGKKPVAAKAKSPKLAVPLFILVDSQTASTAEVFASHFQSAGRAAIIGDRTAGRATETRIFEYETGTGGIVPYALQVSTGKFNFADGKELDGIGITPDLRCVPTPEALIKRMDPCLDIALSMARKALNMPESANSAAPQ